MKRLAILAGLVGVALVAWGTGLHAHLELDTVRNLVDGAGPWGPVVFVALFGLEGVGVPGVVFMLAAIAIWPPSLAFLYNFLGAQTAGLVGFFFARWIGRDWVAARLPENVRRYESRIEERGLETVVLVRLVFFIAPPAHWFLGLSPVRFRDYLLGSMIGMLPWLVAVSYGGGHAFRWLTEQPRETWLLLAGALLVGAFAWRMLRRRGSTRASNPPRAPLAPSPERKIP
ncbi:MAG: VTT domain-containing protein [Myxococcota bacterium]